MYKKLKVLIVASLFPALYFICQLLVQVVFLQGTVYYLGRQKNDVYTETMSRAIAIAKENIYLLTFCSALLCLLLIIFINKRRKQSTFEYYKRISIKQTMFYVIATFGLYIIIALMNGMLIGYFPKYNTEIMTFFNMDQRLLGVIVIGVIAPLMEELIFRGEVYKELNREFSTPMVIFIQAVLFGAIHPIGLQKIQTFIIGIFLGYARAQTKNMWAPTIMHVTNNLIACILVFIVL